MLDRASFQRFAGLERSGRVLDAKTIWVWREWLEKQDLIGDIREAEGLQLAQADFIVCGGQIIDASIVTPSVPHNHREEGEAIKQGEVPKDGSTAKRAQKDVEACWTKKHSKSYYGYQLHANTDRRWGFIRRMEVTTASVHVQGYRAHIQRKGTAQRPISEAQQRRNRRIAKQRAFGEHPFARLAQMGDKHLRTIGLVRARGVIELKVIAHHQCIWRDLNSGAWCSHEAGRSPNGDRGIHQGLPRHP